MPTLRARAASAAHRRVSDRKLRRGVRMFRATRSTAGSRQIITILTTSSVFRAPGQPPTRSALLTPNWRGCEAGGRFVDNELYKVSITNPNGDNTWLGGYRTKSYPVRGGRLRLLPGNGRSPLQSQCHQPRPQSRPHLARRVRDQSSPFVNWGMCTSRPMAESPTMPCGACRSTAPREASSLRPDAEHPVRRGGQTVLRRRTTGSWRWPK